MYIDSEVTVCGIGSMADVSSRSVGTDWEHKLGYISDELLNEIQGCRRCTTICGYRKFPKSSHGNRRSKYLLVSEAPGKASLKDGQYWTGNGGRLLRSILQGVGADLEESFYLTDIVKCWPNLDGEDRSPHVQEVRNCFPYLKKEIAELRPKLVIALGKKVSEMLLDTTILMRRHHGSLHRAGGVDILVLYHPSNINRSMDVSEYRRQLAEIISRQLNEPD